MFVESERACRAKQTHCCTLIDIFVYIYIVLNSPVLLGIYSDILFNFYLQH